MLPIASTSWARWRHCPPASAMSSSFATSSTSRTRTSRDACRWQAARSSHTSTGAWCACAIASPTPERRCRLHSMLPEPVGPRSPDDILAVVYQRTERVRRRRRQQLAAAVAAVAVGVAGLVSLRPGDDEAARVRVVDGRTTQTEEATDESATPITDAVGSRLVTSSPTTMASTKRHSQPSSSGGDNKASTPTTPPLPTATTSPPLPNGPGARLLAEASDADDDAILPAWYYEIVHGSIALDFRSDVVVFTTRYGTPSASGNRETRTLGSQFTIDQAFVGVDVTEADNTLGAVKFHTGAACNGCIPTFDEGEARLTVTV